MTEAPLRTVLGVEPPPGIGALGHAQQDELAALVTAARHAQAAALEQAIRAALKHVPYPVRGLARRMLLG